MNPADELEALAAEIEVHGVQSDKELNDRIRALAAQLREQQREPVGYLYDDDLDDLRRTGEAVIYERKQKFEILAHKEPAITLYAALAQNGPEPKS